jgi:hypothetical protein
MLATIPAGDRVVVAIKIFSGSTTPLKNGVAPARGRLTLVHPVLVVGSWDVGRHG